MEIESQNKSKCSKPLIKATVYFDAQPAFYATRDQIEYLNQKGIATPVQPILRMVSKAIVYEKKVKINWCNHSPQNIINYYTTKFNNKLTCIPHITNEQKLRQAALATYKISEHYFPSFLPAELAFNCTNGSRISIMIGKFPTEITFESENDFYREYSAALSYFFNNAQSILSEDVAQDLIIPELLQKIEDDTFITMFIADELIAIPTTYIYYIHGPKGCPNEATFIKSLINAKIPTTTSIFKSLQHRELTGTFK